MEFKTCPKCDFEWHLKDGDCCPACSKVGSENHEDWHSGSQVGGLFGTGSNAKRTQAVFRALGLLALVYFLYLLLGSP